MALPSLLITYVWRSVLNLSLLFLHVIQMNIILEGFMQLLYNTDGKQ
jgi:hypothetical protein